MQNRKIPDKTPEKLSSIFFDESDSSRAQSPVKVRKVSPLRSPIKTPLYKKPVVQTPLSFLTPSIKLLKVEKTSCIAKCCGSTLFFVIVMLLSVFFASFLVVRTSYVYKRFHNDSSDLIALSKLVHRLYFEDNIRTIDEIIEKIEPPVSKDDLINAINGCVDLEYFDGVIYKKLGDQTEIWILSILAISFTLMVFTSLYFQK